MFARRRPLLRAAAVGGGAYLAGRSRGRHTQQRDYADAEQNERITDLERRQAAPVPHQQAPSMLDQLGKLSALHDQGVLSDEEFAAAKAKLLS